MQHRNDPPKKQPLPSKKRTDSAEKKATEESVEEVLDTEEAPFLNEQEQEKVVTDSDRMNEAGKEEFYD